MDRANSPLSLKVAGRIMLVKISIVGLGLGIFNGRKVLIDFKHDRMQMLGSLPLGVNPTRQSKPHQS